jgi:Tfp pilus assembly protein PilN
MIRINLSPSVAAKRKVTQTRAVTAVHFVPTGKSSRGSLIAVGMLGGWVAIGVVAYLLQSGVQDDQARLQAKAIALAGDATKIKEKVDEEGLQARRNRSEELTVAIEALETKRRTPIYVYHELGNILTTGKQPDIDEVEQRKRVAIDSQARLDENWDARAVWLLSMRDDGNNVLEISGAARDPDDLSEFVKRLRASARFARVSHPTFRLEEVKASSSQRGSEPGRPTRHHYSFELTAQVRYWD